MPTKRSISLERVIEVANVTLASVASELGIRLPSLYNHVAGLPGLRHALALWGARQLSDRLRRAAVGRAGGDAIAAIATAYRAFAHAHPGVYAATLRAARPDEPELMAVGQEIVDILLAVLAPYGLSGNDALHAIRAMRSVLHGFVDLEAAGGFGLPLDCDESYRRLIQMVIQGIGAG
jgi:AcrR family transcriptional regulator